jgi:hypothetical protein
MKDSKTKKLNREAQNRNPGATFRVTVVIVLSAAVMAGIAAELLEVIILLVSFFISL